MQTLLQACRLSAARMSQGIAARILVVAAVLGLAVTSAPAQTGTGDVSGRVQNVGTGRYLNNARLVLDGTNRETFTNEFGEYRFSDVPAGEVKIRASYTGLDAKTLAVTVTAGQSAALDFNLTSAERYGNEDVVTLDAFTVQSNREYEGDSLAQNEQRYAPNVKVVMAADAFGAVNEGNPGEFLKYLPGVSVDYVAADVRTVAVRGFASNFTNVSWDGMRLTSSASGANNRIFEFEQVSINNTSRTEVVKIPTPDTPADSLGGSINFISKNAFERKGAQFNYRVYMNMNSENMDVFTKTPGPGQDKTFKVLPNFDFDYTLPVNDRFGLVITGLSSNQHVEQHRFQPTWNHQQAGATTANPYLQQFQLQDGPKTTNRASVGIKADWKVTENQTLSVAYQDNYYKTFFGNRNINFNMGTNNVPTPSTGTALAWGPDFVQAATGRGAVTQGSSFRDKLGNTSAGNLQWRWNNADWDIDAGMNAVVSRTWYRALARNHFANVQTTLQGVANLRADNINFPYLSFTPRDAAGNVIDQYNLANYRVGTASNDPIDGKATMKSAHVNAERHFDNWSIPMNFKVGADIRQEGRDNRRYSESYTFVGRDGTANTADDNAAAFLDTVYFNQKTGFGSPNVQWINPFALSQSLRDNPSWWTTNAVTNEQNRINNSEKMTETITAGYLQFDGKLMNGKLRFVGGVRYEKTRDEGQGVLNNPDIVWQRGAGGAYVDADNNPANGIQRVLRTDIGALNANGTANSAQAVQAILQERGYRADRTYDGYYPSLHLTYNITDNFLLRLAYAKTIGRPDYANILPNTVVDENDTDPNAVGTLTTRNTALKPWTADNYDLSLEYYFGKGGAFTVGLFKKDISDFFVTRGGVVDAALAGELGLDPRFIGWGVSTTVNGGDAGISGYEFSLIRPLNFLPGWGRYFTVKANGTALHLTGANVPDFRGFISKTGNFSLSYNKAPFVVNANLNYRGRQKGTTITNAALQTGAQYGTTTGFFEYYAPRTNLDLSAEYKLNKRFAFFIAGRNVLNKEQVIERFNAETPSYAKGFRWEEFGVNYSFGIKGTF
jgi:TonB-dependent receptor